MTLSDQQQKLTVSTIPAMQWPEICTQFDDLSYEQTLTYSQAAASRIKASTVYLAVHDRSNGLVAATCLRVKSLPVLRKGIAWSPAGPMMRPKGSAPINADRVLNVLKALRQYSNQSGHILRIRPPVVARHSEDDFAKLAALLGYHPTAKAQPYRTVLIDCSPDEDTLLRGLHGKWRNPLRNALKAGLELEVIPLSESYARFDKMYREVQAAKGFQPDIPPEFYYDLTGPDFDHKVLIATKDDKDIAGMTIGTTGQNAVYLFGATTAQGRKLNAGHFLMWQAILVSKSRGVHWFDLGGIDPEGNPSVTRFKQRTGGIGTTAPGPFEYRPTKASTALITVVENIYARLRRRS